MKWLNLYIVLFLTACVSLPSQKTIQLSNLEPLPASSSNQTVPLRVAVAAVISPKGTAESYQALVQYIGAQINRPVELVQRRTYAEVNDLIENGYVDLAFVCTSAYVEGHAKFGMELLVAPQVNGGVTYKSYLIVPRTSLAQSMSDLRGKVFAFTDPISNTGRVYPTYLVQKLNSTPEVFFARTFFTYSHDDAIRAVTNGVADGAAVDSLVYEFAAMREPSLLDKIKIIHRSPPFGIPPVVVNPNIRPQLKVELQSLLLEMANLPQGQKSLQAIGVDRFVMIEDNAYNSVRELLNETIPIAP